MDLVGLPKGESVGILEEGVLKRGWHTTYVSFCSGHLGCCGMPVGNGELQGLREGEASGASLGLLFLCLSSDLPLICHKVFLFCCYG